jgi:HSP20 family protein
MSQLVQQQQQQRRRRTEPTRWEPRGDLDPVAQRMQRILEQTFGDLADWALVTGDRGIWSPPVDIEEQDDAYVVEAELPGVKRDDINIEIVGNELMINGEFKERDRKGILRKQTRPVGRFDYRVALPEHVDGEKVEAHLNDGVLTVRVPKSERAQRKKIDVK